MTGRKGKDLAWGDPASEPCYGHSVKYHGKQLPIAKLREWAMKVFKKDQGQWLDNRFIVEAEQRAPLVAGSHAVEMGRSVGRVFHPDGRVTDNVTTVIVVRRPNLTVKVSYPYSPKSSTTGKKVRETVENSQRSARPLTDPGPGSGDGESNPR